MPVFEYRCEGCAAETEVIVLQGEVAPTECSDCGAPLRKRWSRVAVNLVGWGFARNDSMLPDNGKRNSFKKVREKAAELFD